MINLRFISSIAAAVLLDSCVTSSARSESKSDSITADPIKPSLDGVDLYGSRRVTLEMIRNSHGELLQMCLDESIREGDGLECDRQAFSQEIARYYGLAFAHLSIIKYFNLHNIPGRQVYATIDLVEKSDAPKRMKFLPRPAGQYPDPGELLKSWDDYQKAGFELLQTGEISGMREECPAYHCIFGHTHPRLAPFKKVFVEGVSKHKSELIRIFLDDRSDQARANAAFLLAYIPNGNELIETLATRITDESEAVRNNVIRVFSDIAAFHQQLVLPIKAVVPLLDYPETTDRNKASMVVFGLASNKDQLPKYRPLIMKEAVPNLLRLLRLEQPNNHDPAYMILRVLSGLDYGERDYAAWDEWYRSQTGK